MENPGKQHWSVAKWILKYLKGTSDVSICYKSTYWQTKGFVGSDFGGNKDGWKYTILYTFTLITGVAKFDI